jgi:hypothetical protein
MGPEGKSGAGKCGIVNQHVEEPCIKVFFFRRGQLKLAHSL